MTIHPLLRLLATQPHLLGDHVHAYTELITAEVGKTSKMWVSRVVYYGAAGALLLLGVVFAGIALMLWGSASDDMNAPWLLVLVPLVPLAAGGFCIYKAKAMDSKQKAFDTVKEQFQADLAMLREVGAAT